VTPALDSTGTMTAPRRSGVRVGLCTSLAIFTASASRADSLCHAASTGELHPPANGTIVIPAFDPASGTLQGVHVLFEGLTSGTLGLENGDSIPHLVTSQFTVSLRVTYPGGEVLSEGEMTRVFAEQNLGAFDGSIDYAGTSGITNAISDLYAYAESFLFTPGDLAVFVGPSGGGGSISFAVMTDDHSAASGSPNLSLDATSTFVGTMNVCYDYTPSITSFCSGDGSGAACPCGNESAMSSGEGCRHSGGVGGRLIASGVPDVGAESLVLTVDQVPASALVLFLQGDAMAGSGAGVPFGDGLRCVGGTIVRLKSKLAVSGQASYPVAGETPISVQGAVSPGDVRYYQVWFRNAAEFCTSDTFNLTNGLIVQWMD
jgi:hypothetical protein